MGQLDNLSKEERKALEEFRENYQKDGINSFDLVPEVQAVLFQHYLQGSSFKDLLKINPTVTLGQLVSASVQGNWFKLKQEYLQELFFKTRDRVAQTALEGMDFMINALSAVHKKHSEGFEKYKQTGEIVYLGGFNITSFKQYKDCLDILMAFTKDINKSDPPKAPGRAPSLPQAEETEDGSIFELMEKKKELEGGK